MVFPEMEITQWGFFDSRVKFPKVIITDPRAVTEYELELYTDPQPGTGYINGTPIPLEKGTMICAKPGAVRYSKLHFKCLHIHVRTEDAALAEMLEKLPDHFIVSDLSPFTDIFHKLLSLDISTFPEQRLLMQSYLHRFLYLVIEECRFSDPAATQHRRTMMAAEEYIRAHLSEDLGLEHLASRANLSPVYFHKLFSAHLGMTPAAFVLSCRIAAAKAMLKTGELSIAEIAIRCGFSSQSYFNYKFKEVTAETPLQYRKARLSRLKL
jgi:AraC-like DNA-binding protein